ncbi:hypothetical protein QRD43_20290 [Pelomonas sp. APW6]|uniref:Uncharacterized protein n=1 Tax=Roseateles subflavus TaxID=3053353 RepID=A0ABT7LN03_9BURK|nr:hypothetical protein [Pelomonas sp. APW6]MDL5034252.1 hypothetical protein [Pelomonas sp. APW6]
MKAHDANHTAGAAPRAAAAATHDTGPAAPAATQTASPGPWSGQPLQRQQRAQLALLQAPAGGPGPIQRKGRIDLDKVPESKRESVRLAIEQLKKSKRESKDQRALDWLQQPDDSTDQRYNEDMASIRQRYEEGIRDLGKDLPEEAHVHGDAYYGAPVGETGVYKRGDNKKEYVKDSRGTFVPRYIRRELNRNDPKTGDLNPTGISTYQGLSDIKNMDTTGLQGTDGISWPHREFMQQSGGGGGNQFAFSHTATQRPILSNSHTSFGEHDNGAILTDLSQLDPGSFLAQWQLDPVTGHKVPLAPGVHSALGFKEKDLGPTKGIKPAVSPGERDEVVRRSGYRNMEVVSANVPERAITTRWDGIDGTRETYVKDNGRSKRGQKMVEERRRLEK